METGPHMKTGTNDLEIIPQGFCHLANHPGTHPGYKTNFFLQGDYHFINSQNRIKTLSEEILDKISSKILRASSFFNIKGCC